MPCKDQRVIILKFNDFHIICPLNTTKGLVNFTK